MVYAHAINVTRPSSANENARNIFDVISLFLALCQLTEIWLTGHTLVKRKLELNL